MNIDELTGWVEYGTGTFTSHAKIDPNFPPSHCRAWNCHTRSHIPVTQELLDTGKVRPVTRSDHVRKLEEGARTHRVTKDVGFYVPTHGSEGTRYDTWDEAVAVAWAKIKRFEYPGQTVNMDAGDYHPLRNVQEGGTLVSYSRAFVDLRIIGPRTNRPLFRWEVFYDGTAEEDTRGML